MNKSIQIRNQKEKEALQYAVSMNLDFERDMACEPSHTYTERLQLIDNAADLFLVHTILANKRNDNIPFRLVLPIRTMNTLQMTTHRFLDVIADMVDDQDGDEQKQLSEHHHNLIRLDERFNNI